MDDISDDRVHTAYRSGWPMREIIAAMALDMAGGRRGRRSSGPHHTRAEPVALTAEQTAKLEAIKAEKARVLEAKRKRQAARQAKGAQSYGNE